MCSRDLSGDGVPYSVEREIDATVFGEILRELVLVLGRIGMGFYADARYAIFNAVRIEEI